jgi:hypothetical protein
MKSPPGQARRAVFVCYSHRDADWLERLRIHLKPLEPEFMLRMWDDRSIRAGMKWRDEIRSNGYLESAPSGYRAAQRFLTGALSMQH